MITIKKLLERTSCIVNQNRTKGHLNRPRLKLPYWFLKKDRNIYENGTTEENKIFLSEFAKKKFMQIHEANAKKEHQYDSPVKRTGLIGKKIGEYPLWLQNGKKITTTLIHIVENSVIKYFAPDDVPESKGNHPKYGVMLIGAKNVDSISLTKQYTGLFRETGAPPKEKIARFFVSPSAEISPGTPLNANYFQVGQYVDIRGKTIYRGFQGVVKRHGFKGMPASHGVTKTHRRPGNIGGGGEKGRVWPGTKMPGHMGNRYRVMKGLQILRINMKCNILWVIGHSVPGNTNDFVYIYDTILPLRKNKTNANRSADDLFDDCWFEDLHNFKNETILFNDQ